MEGNDDDEEGLFAPMILLKRMFVIGNTSIHTQEGVLSFFFFRCVCCALVEKCVVNRVIIGSKTFFAFF